MAVPTTFKSIGKAVLSTDPATMFVVFKASTPDLDREGEVVPVEAFDLSEYALNPVYLAYHDQKRPVGTSTDPAGQFATAPASDAAGAYLRSGCKFSQANPDGAIFYGMYDEGTLRGVSVGFVGGQKRHVSLADGRRAVSYAPNTAKLVEISCVPCPMNPNALRLGAGKGFNWADYCDRDRIASLLSRHKAFGETMPAFVRKAFAPLAAPLTTHAADLTKVRRLTINVRVAT